MGKLQVCVRTFLCSEKISECYSFKQHYLGGGVTTTITSTINVPCLCQMALLAGGRTCSSRTTFTFVEHQKAKVLGFYNNDNIDNLFAFKSFKPLLLDERATWLYLKFIADFFVCGQNKLFVITIQEKEPLILVCHSISISRYISEQRLQPSLLFNEACQVKYKTACNTFRYNVNAIWYIPLKTPPKCDKSWQQERESNL